MDGYKIARARQIPMAEVVNQIISEAISDIQVETRFEVKEAPATKEVYYIAERNLG